MDLFFNNSTDALCGKRNLMVSHMVVPDEVGNPEIERTISALNSMFRPFGTIKKKPEMKVIKYNPDAGIQELESRIRDLENS